MTDNQTRPQPDGAIEENFEALVSRTDPKDPKSWLYALAGTLKTRATQRRKTATKLLFSSVLAIVIGLCLIWYAQWFALGERSRTIEAERERIVSVYQNNKDSYQSRISNADTEQQNALKQYDDFRADLQKELRIPGTGWRPTTSSELLDNWDELYFSALTGNAYLASQQTLIRRASKSKKWKGYPLGSERDKALSIADSPQGGSVYVGTERGRIYHLDSQSERPTLIHDGSLDRAQRSLGRPVETNAGIFVSNKRGHLFQVSVNGKNPEWPRIKLPEGATKSQRYSDTELVPSRYDGSTFVMNTGRTLIAVSGNEAHTLWEGDQRSTVHQVAPDYRDGQFGFISEQWDDKQQRFVRAVRISGDRSGQGQEFDFPASSPEGVEESDPTARSQAHDWDYMHWAERSHFWLANRAGDLLLVSKTPAGSWSQVQAWKLPTSEDGETGIDRLALNYRGVPLAVLIDGRLFLSSVSKDTDLAALKKDPTQLSWRSASLSDDKERIWDVAMSGYGYDGFVIALSSTHAYLLGNSKTTPWQSIKLPPEPSAEPERYFLCHEDTCSAAARTPSGELLTSAVPVEIWRFSKTPPIEFIRTTGLPAAEIPGVLDEPILGLHATEDSVIAVGANSGTVASYDRSDKLWKIIQGPIESRYRYTLQDAAFVQNRGVSPRTDEGSASTEPLPGGSKPEIAHSGLGLWFLSAASDLLRLDVKSGNLKKVPLPEADGKTLSHIRFNESGSMGWVFSDQGGVWRTTDGGKNWPYRKLPVEESVVDLAIGDSLAQKLWAVTDGGKVLYSDNAGENWFVASGGSGSEARRFTKIAVDLKGALAWALLDDGTLYESRANDLGNEFETPGELLGYFREGVEGGDKRWLVKKAHMDKLEQLNQKIENAAESITANKAELTKLETVHNDRLRKFSESILNSQTAPGTVGDQFTKEDFTTLVLRVTILSLTLYLATVLGNAYRYNQRIADRYLAYADLILLVKDEKRLNLLLKELTLSDLGELMSTQAIDFGKPPKNPIDNATEIFKEGIKAVPKPKVTGS